MTRREDFRKRAIQIQKEIVDLQADIERVDIVGVADNLNDACDGIDALLTDLDNPDIDFKTLISPMVIFTNYEPKDKEEKDMLEEKKRDVLSAIIYEDDGYITLDSIVITVIGDGELSEGQIGYIMKQLLWENKVRMSTQENEVYFYYNFEK